MGLLDDIKNLGVSDFDGEIYEKNASEDTTNKDTTNKDTTNKDTTNKDIGKKSQKQVTELDCLFQKNYECPLCRKKIVQPTVKTNYLRMVGQDKDLRPRYQFIDANKYDVIHCNHCGYASLSRYFGPLANVHKKLLSEKIQLSYVPVEEIGETISYEEAKVRYGLAMENAIARQAHNSEKALISLRSAWICRGLQEETELYMENRISGLKEMANTVPSLREEVEAKNKELIEVVKRVNLGKIEEFKKEEETFLSKALEGLLLARKEETPPIAGMNDITLDYLLGVLCMHFERYQEAVKLLQGILLSKTAGSVQKNRAREIMIELKRKMDEQ